MLCDGASGQESGNVGATVFVNPLGATLRIQPKQVQQGNRASVRVTISNHGPAPVNDVTATLLVDLQGVVIMSAPKLDLSILRARSSRTLEWTVCGVTPGNYLAMAVVMSGDAQGRTFRAETGALLLEVSPRNGRPKPC
jgi:hypothetical protein